jgi:hypothetical protein
MVRPDEGISFTEAIPDSILWNHCQDEFIKQFIERFHAADRSYA